MTDLNGLHAIKVAQMWMIHDRGYVVTDRIQPLDEVPQTLVQQYSQVIPANVMGYSLASIDDATFSLWIQAMSKLNNQTPRAILSKQYSTADYTRCVYVYYGESTISGEDGQITKIKKAKKREDTVRHDNRPKVALILKKRKLNTKIDVVRNFIWAVLSTNPTGLAYVNQYMQSLGGRFDLATVIIKAIEDDLKPPDVEDVYQVEVQVRSEIKARLRNTPMCQDSILIVGGPLTSGARQLFELFGHYFPNHKAGIYFEQELLVNPTIHIDTPLHTRLSEEEKKALLIELRVDISMLPLISLSDPIVRYYGWRRGDLIKITRDDSIIRVVTPTYIQYRVVF